MSLRTPRHRLCCAIVVFIGTGCASATSEATPAGSVYLFTSFRNNGENGLRFLYSDDGYRWRNIPGTFLKPHVGAGKLMRYPSLVQGPNGTFHLVWTTAWKDDRGFGYAHSKDLVHWSEQRFIPVMEHEATTVNVWAPELFFDESNRRFVIFWASTISGRFPDHLEPHDDNQRMYYTTTSDFETFTPTKLFFDPGFSVIDGTIAKHGNRYVLVFKDNTRPRRNLRVAFGDSPLGPWHDVSEPFTGHFTEGPSALKIGGTWLIFFDAYHSNSYSAVSTHDFRSFTDVSQKVFFPKGHKHGTVLRVSRKLVDRLRKTGALQSPDVRLPLVSALSAHEIATRLAKIDAVIKAGPFRAQWDSLSQFQPPDWFRNAKFGIFIHWGAYSVPAFENEWYPRNMYVRGSRAYKHHLATFGSQSQFGYKDFIPRFKAEHFDAQRWMALFRAAGARYVVPVAEHSDGFAMYDSDVTEWCAANNGPKRDVLHELAQAAQREGLVFAASSHRAEHWWFFDRGMQFDSDVRDRANAALYGPAVNQQLAENQSEPPDKAFLDDWLLRSCEIVDKYRPQLIYFDWWICQPVFQPYLKRFAAYYYNRGVEWKQSVAITYKRWEGESFPEPAGILDIERGAAEDIRTRPWQCDTSVSKNSWGYVANDDYKDVGELVDDLIDIVSKNGTLLLNIGPKADGTIPTHVAGMLREIGRWLATNGEAIYDTRPWRVFGEGPTRVTAGAFADRERAAFTASDVRFTTKGDILYAIGLGWPENRKLLIKSLSRRAGLATGEIRAVQLLGYEGEVQWQRTDQGLVVFLPEKPPCDFAVALKIAGLAL